ncbi:MAG: WD40 repeat domain-containing protein, partial [Gammaproteobacteria bacterium]
MFDVSIAAPKPGPKPVPVSPRLSRELIHPNRSSVLAGIRFSPDGRRLIAGDYPGGVVQLWDVASGNQLTRFETGYGYRSSADYIHLTPDWRTLYVSGGGRAKSEAIEKDGKRLMRVEHSGDIRVWDLESGRLLRTYQHDPPRYIFFMSLAPDGASFITGERLPGLIERLPSRATTLWNAEAGTYRALAEGHQPYSVLYSPDSRWAAASTDDDESGYSKAVTL